MRFWAVVAIVLPGLLGSAGCTGTREPVRLDLPGFGAPEQWEPELERTAAEAPPES